MTNEPDDTARVLVIVIPCSAHSPGELVRLGFQIEAELDEDAANHIHTHPTPVEVCFARSGAELLEIIAEAAVNDEWLAILRGDQGRVRAVAIGPLHLEYSPVLAGTLEQTAEFGGQA